MQLLKKSIALLKIRHYHLNYQNKIAGIHIISIGTLDNAFVEPRDVYQAALMNARASIKIFLDN